MKAGSVRINGYTEAAGQNAEAGKFKVAITASGAETAGKTEITFAEGDQAVGDTVRVSYKRRLVDTQKVDVGTNSTTAKGALYAHWPVYSSGGDCTEAAVKAWLHLYLPRVRATALPGFDSSYKSAATNSVTFAAIDPKRGDNKMFGLYFEPLDENGEIVTKTEATTVEWD